MSKVKIFLGKNETIEEAELDLFKALNHHVSGEVHQSDSFDEPAIKSAADQLEIIHQEIYKEMIDEINLELEKEYKS